LHSGVVEEREGDGVIGGEGMLKEGVNAGGELLVFGLAGVPFDSMACPSTDGFLDIGEGALGIDGAGGKKEGGNGDHRALGMAQTYRIHGDFLLTRGVRGWEMDVRKRKRITRSARSATAAAWTIVRWRFHGVAHAVARWFEGVGAEAPSQREAAGDD
jgi:hypothetical protein